MAETTSALTPRQFAARFGLSNQTVYNMIGRGELAAIRVGKRSLRILPEDVAAFEASRRISPAHHRAELLGADTLAYLRELAESAPPLSHETKDAIRAAFRGAGQ